MLLKLCLFTEAFATGFIFVSGGELNYPGAPESSDPEGYRRFTAVLILACQINDQVIFCPGRSLGMLLFTNYRF